MDKCGPKKWTCKTCPTPKTYIVVFKGRLRVRSIPNTSAEVKILGLLNHGDQVTSPFPPTNTGWLRIDSVTSVNPNTGVLGTPTKRDNGWICMRTPQHKDLVSLLTPAIRAATTKFIIDRAREIEKKRKAAAEEAERRRKAEADRLEMIRKSGFVSMTLGGQTPKNVGFAAKTFASKTEDIVPIKRLHTHVASASSGLASLGTELLCQMNEMSGPKHWTPLPTGQNDAIIELASWSDEYKEALRHFKKTSSKRVVKIERVQNHYLHQRYLRRKMMMMSSGRPHVNEMLLFHGTRQTPPTKIWDGLNACGFDPRLGSGYYGKGAYFAQNSSYSANSYAHTLANTQPPLKQIFLATVLIGEYKDYKTTTMNSLKRAPDLPSNHSHAPGLYDSVKGGPHSGTFMYIVYNADQSYPLYLYTFRA